jgi:hypothetical protein
MELNQISNGTKVYGADDTLSMTAGEKIKVDVAGVKEFEQTVPVGKKWTVNISMKVTEEDL